MSIDFTPTAYTVRNPGNGQQVRYEGEGWARPISVAQVGYANLAAEYPALFTHIVPDHFVQEYCRALDAAAWSGGGDVNVNGIILRLAEKGLGQARFS